MKQYLSITERNKIDYQDMIDHNEANNEVVQVDEANQIEYENITEQDTDETVIEKITDDFVLFNEPYSIRKKIPCEVSMKAIDHKLPPANILERGAQSIRTYWNSKNKRRVKA